MKKTPQKICDTLLQKINKQDNPKCLLCASDCQVGHHFFAKSISSFLRYDFRNIIPLCNGCHWRIHASGDPSYEQRIIDIKGRDWYDELDKIRRNPIQTNVKYYKDTEERLSAMLKGDIEY
jgi:hypothetical protein